MGRWILVIFSLPAQSSIVTQELTSAVQEDGLNEFFKFRPYRSGHDRVHTIMSVGRHDRDMPDSMREAATDLLLQYGLRLPDWRSDERETHTIRRIRFQTPDPISPSDPLSPEDGNVTSPDPYPEQTDNYNKLLQWLSAHGQGTWQQFRTACHTLGLDPTLRTSNRILRRLRLLGHVEVTSDDRPKWFIAPSSLVTTDSANGCYSTFLAGQRSPVLLKALRDAAQIQTEPQHHYDAPTLVRATFDSQVKAERFTKDFSRHHHSLFLAGRAGHNIARALQNLFDWERQMASPSVVIPNYKFEFWQDGRFSALPLPSLTGMYRLSHLTDRYGRPQLTLFYDAELGLWRRADWYGLRYLMLRRSGERIEFYYDRTFRTLSIDRNQRLPDMYERALVLASGRLPVLQNNQVTFGDVPAELGRTVADKLEAEFVE